MFFIIFGGLRKNEYFGGYEDFVDIFRRSSQNWTGLVLGVISMYFMVFSLGKCTEWGFLLLGGGVVRKFQMFFGDA